MYESFYQLNADPFRLSPDPGFSFQHHTYRKAMTNMLHALQRAEGFIMITGQPGTGKTTLVSELVSTLRSDQISVAKIVSAQLSANDLLDLVAYSFNLDPEGCSKAKVLFQLEAFLKQEHQQGRRSLLIIDEAQGMGTEALEELRLLTNIMAGNHQLLQIFLLGQDRLQDTVNTSSLEQLHQRLIAATHLEPLDTEDTRAYIKHRLRCVNWQGNPLISTEAYDWIRRCSRGIPRQINQICRRLFLHGCLEEKQRLGVADLKIVVNELRRESLLPMDGEGILEMDPWPEEPVEESYEAEAQTIAPAQKTVRPTIATLPGIKTAGQYSSPKVADTPDSTGKTSRTAVWSGAVAVLVLVLATAILAPNLIDGDIDQFANDQETLPMNQAVTQRLVQSASEAGSMTEGTENVFSSHDREDLLAGSVDKTLEATVQQNEPQNEPNQDEPVTAREITPVSPLSPDSQPESAASPLPVEQPVVVEPALSEEEEIAVLLAHGQESFGLNRLLTPKNESAYQYFQQVLELDPGNSDALNGIELIVERYTALAAYALDKNDNERAGLYITRGLQVSPSDAGLMALRERLNAALTKPAPVPEPEPEPEPEPKSEGIIKRLKNFFTQPPGENN
jgi:type II secretory pathway predicted ATPase ExeA